MTIIHLNTQKGWRGGERQLVWLIEGLQEKNISQLLICRKKSALEKYAIQHNLKHIAFTINPTSLLAVASYISKIILEAKEKRIVDCHDSKSHTIGLLIKLFFTKNFKLVVHRKVNFEIKGWFSKKIKYSATYVDSIICISKAVQKQILKNSNTLRTTVIYDAIKPASSKKSTFLQQKTGNSTCKFIAYIAALTPEKDHITFLKTAKKIVESRSDVHFVIIGSGDEQQRLEKLVSALEITKRVSFLGFLENLPDVIPEIDLLLFTSKSEGLGSTILDFFMAKIPVVTVKNGGAEEMVFNNQTGFIAEIGAVDHLAKYCLQIFNETENTKRMTQNAYQFAVENFSVEKMIQKTWEEYNDLLSE